MTVVALPTQVFLLTHSTLAVGAIAFVQLVGILLFALGGGAIADSVDRRLLLLATQLGLGATSFGLALLALAGDPPVVAIYGIAFVAAAIGAVDQPARASALPRLVPTGRLPAAIALNQLNYQAASVIGPAFGGLLLVTVGAAGAYLVDAVTFGAAIGAVLLIRPLPPIGGLARPTLGAVREGLAFAGRHRVILSTFAVDLDAMIFGMPTSLFPALAIDVFGVGAGGVGLLAAAPGVGAFFGALLSGWVSAVRRPGRATLAAVAVWGAAITLFGLARPSFPLALLFLAVAGGADVLSAVFRSTIIQVETPDELRGRVTALHVLVVSSGPRMGDVEAAAVAALVGPQLSVISGGVLCLAGLGVVAQALPELRTYVRRDLRPAAPAGARPAVVAGGGGPTPPEAPPG